MKQPDEKLDELLSQWRDTTLMSKSKLESVRDLVVSSNSVQTEQLTSQWWMTTFSGLKSIMRAGLNPISGQVN